MIVQKICLILIPKSLQIKRKRIRASNAIFDVKRSRTKAATNNDDDKA